MDDQAGLLKSMIEKYPERELEACSWIRRVNIVKIAILLKEIYRFSEIPIKHITLFSTKI